MNRTTHIVRKHWRSWISIIFTDFEDLTSIESVKFFVHVRSRLEQNKNRKYILMQICKENIIALYKNEVLRLTFNHKKKKNKV